MTYFADLSAHTYTPAEGRNLLNVGWLDSGHAFERGETPAQFREALRRLVAKPVWIHRGKHFCELCPDEPRAAGSGQIRVEGERDLWYAAPALIHHYVEAHGYRPPEAFIAAVMRHNRVDHAA
jgi:hypothetical protein